jgi:Mg2+/Co2+ transporter CorB
LTDIPTSALFGLLGCLILLSAFFSGSETALMTLNRYRLRHLAKTGHSGAKRADRLLERPDRLIGLILLGNNFVNILASSLATIVALRLGGEGAIAAAAGILTLVILIFAEVAPKTMAALHPERLAFPASFVYIPLLKLLYPLVWTVNIIANTILRGMGVTPEHTAGQALSQEELKTVVTEAGALIPKKHQKMLLSILELGEAAVEDIMIPRNEVDGIDLDDPLEEIIQQLQTSPYTRVVVFDDGIDNLVGILHVREAMRRLVDGFLTEEMIREICAPPYFVPEGTTLTQQLHNFQKTRHRVGLVVDEYGDLLGMITLVDLLEEIVGEFATDPADSLEEVTPQADGSYLVSGNADVRDLVRTFKWKLPTDGPRTINGLIIEYMETIPEPGTSLLIEGYPVEILQTQDNSVKMIRFEPAKRRKQMRLWAN